MNQPFLDQSLLNYNEQKKKIRKTAGLIGIALLFTVAITFLWASVYISLATALGFSVEKAYELLTDPTVLMLINTILSTTMFTLPFLIVFTDKDIKWYETVSFKKPDTQYLVSLVLLSVAFCGFANVATSVIQNIFYSIGIDISAPEIPDPEGFFGKFVSFAGAVVIAPLVEEFAMRGVVMGALRRYGDTFAIVTSAIIFGLMHGNLTQAPFAFIVGIAIGFAVIKTGSIYTGILIHFINNLTATLMGILVSSVSSTYLQNAVYVFFLSACMILGFVGVYLLRDRSREVFILEKYEGNLTPKQTTKIFFTSPTIIIYIILIAIETVLNFVG